MKRSVPALLSGWIFVMSIPAATGIEPLERDPVTLHVSVTGDDSRCGTRPETALRTVSAAAARLRPGDTARIHAGVYREVLLPMSDGTAEAPVRFEAAHGAEVVFSGLERVTGWQHVEGSIYRAQVDWTLGAENQVFRDGNPLTEARWPNRQGADPFHPEGARARREGSAFDRLQCPDFPDHWTEEDLKGATVWCMALYRWASWTAPVSGYDPDTRTLLLEGHDTWWVKANHDPGKLPRYGTYEPAEFYISNARILLDAPGEWFWDEEEGFLYLVAEEGADPGEMNIEAKRRAVGIDLSGRTRIHLDNLGLHGATLRMEDSEDCRVTKLDARYIHHTRGGFTAMQVPGAEGILISGRNNVLRDSVIGHSTGSGVSLRGEDNALVNSLIHDTNTIGAYCCAVVLGWRSARNLVSHNTIRDSGRDGLQFQGGSHLIQFNHVYRSGRICHDTGAIYLGGQDGENTVIRNNWVHTVSTGLGIGIYLDNYMSNFIVHHNVVWNISNKAMQLNQPSNYNMVFHNTLFGGLEAKFSPWEGPETMFGSLLANNLMRVAPELKAGYIEVGTVLHDREIPGESPEPEDFFFGAAGGKAIPLPGIQKLESGVALFAGAYPPGGPLWRAGHDFDETPDPVWAPADSYYRNYIRNGSFTRQEQGRPLEWQGLTGEAEVTHHEGWNDPPADARFSVYGNSLELKGASEASVTQDVEDLPPGATFVFAAYIRTADAEDVMLEVRNGGDMLAAGSYAHSETGVWRLVRVPFTVPPTGSVRLLLRKPGSGAAYVDNAGLIPHFDAETLCASIVLSAQTTDPGNHKHE